MHLHAPCSARQGQRPTLEFLRPVYQELDDPQPANDWTLNAGRQFAF